MKRYGCIGKKLTHSFSKEIHAKLADYTYELIELSEEEIAPFFEQKAFSAINVTIPYKQTVIPYIDQISPIAKKIGAVNTVVNRNGLLFGYNTDYYGMKALIQKNGIDLTGKKVLILGTGGTSKTARVLADDMGAAEILLVSRRKAEEYITYDEAVHLHADAEVIINTTPSGMYPDCESKPIDIRSFTHLSGVIDAVYNPLCTNLVLDAKAQGIKAEGGLYMLVMQAVVAVEKFLDIEIEKAVADKVFSSVYASKENIILTGLSTSQKQAVGKVLEANGYDFFDVDTEIERNCGYTASKRIADKESSGYHDIEFKVVRELSSKNSCVLSVGCSTLLKEENIRCLKRSGRIFFFDETSSKSDTDSQIPLCTVGHAKTTADIIIPKTESAQAAAQYILGKRIELLQNAL